MVGLLMRMLGPEKRALIELMIRVYDQLDTPEERKHLGDYCREMLADGQIGMTEWSRFGKKLGVFKFGKT